MKKNLGWAQARLARAHVMRSGAWYQVVNDKDPALVVLDVARRNVAMPRDLLQISQQRPEQFSVVARSPGYHSEERGISDDVGAPARYAVCPMSATRVQFSGHPEQLECPRCGHRGRVNWEELA